MGCSSSKSKADAEAAAEKQRQRDAANAAMNAPKLDPRDFMLTKLKDQTIVKEPGSINGQQFIIEECENCTIYLLDHSATVSIDECKNCRIFVGPCESSVFVRTSSHLKLVIAAQQLRTRECRDLDILLYVSAGQPVIESTTGVRLGCFDFNYFGLAAQFVAASLDPWYSEWSNVHDFTASGGGASTSWSFIDSSVTGTDLLPPLSVSKPGLENLPGFVTPRTWGQRPAPVANPQRFLVAIAPGQHDDIGFDLLENRLRPVLQSEDDASPSAWLVRSRRVRLTDKKDRVAAIFYGAARKAQESFMPRALGQGSVLGFELLTSPAELPRVMQLVRDAATEHPGLIYITQPEDSKQALETFFENLAVM